MPAYDYVCQECDARFEVRMSMAAHSEGAHPRCETCGSPRVERAFTAVSVMTSGRGGGASSSAASCGNRGFT